MVHRNASHKVSSHQTRDLVWFADSSNIPWNAPTMFHPDQIATVLQKSIPQSGASLSQQSNLFPIGEVLTYNDSKKGLSRICQILGNWQCKWLLSALRTFASSFPFPEKFLFHTGVILSAELPSLLPIAAYRWLCRESHPSLRTLWSFVIESPNMFRSGNDCTSALSARSPCQFGSQADIAVSVLREMSFNTVLARHHFCSRFWR